MVTSLVMPGLVSSLQAAKVEGVGMSADFDSAFSSVAMGGVMGWVWCVVVTGDDRP